MTASLYTHRQELDGNGHKPHHTVTVTVPAGDPRRRKPTARQQRIYTGRVPVVDEPVRKDPDRATDVAAQPVVRVPFNREASYRAQTGRAAPTPAQRRRIAHHEPRTAPEPVQAREPRLPRVLRALAPRLPSLFRQDGQKRFTVYGRHCGHVHSILDTRAEALAVVAGNRTLRVRTTVHGDTAAAGDGARCGKCGTP